ncbi:MAG: ribose 5-phosphate isomerase B [Rhodospirillales bacterium]|nr:ribose 5-phosphate isomerase B [Rhodospirillales bacterium]MDE2574527.1 ribose 5-phosphate isomerase B [Rhodospirillales bacterium]
MNDTAPLDVAIGCDHAGFPLKAPLVAALVAAGHRVLDMGTSGPGRVDYPDHAHPVCAAVESGRARFGVLICGSGIGMSIAANRHGGIRCVLAGDATAARLGRAHNDANVLALGARLTGEEVALDALAAFLATAFEGGRHVGRLAKLTPA